VIPSASAKPAAAETFTGLTVGHAVTIKSGVVVGGILGLVVRDGNIVNSNSGVEVPVPVSVTLPVTVILVVLDELGTRDVVIVDVVLRDVVGVKVPVPVSVTLPDTVILDVMDELAIRDLDGVAGTAVPLMDAASLPTVISIPQTSGSVNVAE